jgi:hypothetical protein
MQKFLSILADLQTKVDTLIEDLRISRKDWQEGLAQSATDLQLQWNSKLAAVEKDACTGRTELKQLVKHCESKADVWKTNLKVRMDTLEKVQL